MRYSFFVAVALCVSSLAAHADTVVPYTSQTAFNAASTTTTYFIPAPAGGYLSQPVSNPYTIGPVTLSVSSGNFGSLNIFDDGTYGHGQTYLGDNDGLTENLSFSSATAIGLEIGTFSRADTLAFDVDGSLFDFTTPKAQSPIFVGFTSTTPIAGLSITETSQTNQEIDILSFQLGSAATPASITPEPSSFALLGTGLLGVAGVVRKRFA